MMAVHLTDWSAPDPSLEARYEAVVTHYLTAVQQLERIRGILVRFADAPLTISSCQPILDLAQEMRTADIALDLAVHAPTPAPEGPRHPITGKRLHPLGAALNEWRQPPAPVSEDGSDDL